ncbi:MAG: hypothetical protein WCJ30_07150 [Deltaproteobacteria bacterium]
MALALGVEMHQPLSNRPARSATAPTTGDRSMARFDVRGLHDSRRRCRWPTVLGAASIALGAIACTPTGFAFDDAAAFDVPAPTDPDVRLSPDVPPPPDVPHGRAIAIHAGGDHTCLIGRGVPACVLW